MAGFVGWPSSSPPNGRPVLLLDVLGLGGRLGSVPVVPVALGPHGMLCWCIAPLMVGRAVAVLGLGLGGACPWGRKVLKTGTTCPVPPEPALHAQPGILYIPVPFVFPFGPLVPVVCTRLSVAKPLRFAIPFGAFLCSLWEPRGAVPAWWCGVRARVRWPAALARSAGCRARCILCRAVLRGSGGVCSGASVRLSDVRVVLLGGTPAFSVAWRFSRPPAVVAATSVL